MRLFAVAALGLSVVALATAAAAGAFGGSWQPARGVAPPLSEAQLQKLGELAFQAAARDGDPHPSAAFVVPTTRYVAEEVAAGDNGEPNTPAYFVLLQGHFTLANARIPPGAKAPTGTLLTLTFSPSRCRCRCRFRLRRARRSRAYGSTRSRRSRPQPRRARSHPRARASRTTLARRPSARSRA